VVGVDKNPGAQGQTERRLVGFTASKIRQPGVQEEGELGLQFCTSNSFVVYWIQPSNFTISEMSPA